MLVGFDNLAIQSNSQLSIGGNISTRTLTILFIVGLHERIE